MKTSYANGGKIGGGHHLLKTFYLMTGWEVLSSMMTEFLFVLALCIELTLKLYGVTG